MIKHVLFLLFLYGIKTGSGSSNIPQEQTIESKDLSQNGIKKNEVGANGFEANMDKITRNFQNPVLEYLLSKNSERTHGPPQRGVVREIRHSQTLLIPNSLRGPFPQFFINQLPQFESHKKPEEEGSRNPDDSPFENFWNFIKNKTQPGGSKVQENVVSSPVLHLNKNQNEIKEESTRIQMYPAVAVVINTFNKDGTLKNSVTHFQPDFDSIKNTANENAGESFLRKSKPKYKTRSNTCYLLFKAYKPLDENKNTRSMSNSQYTVNNLIRGESSYQRGNNRQGISWPLASYFPIVINDPFLSVYNAFATSMYNAVSSMVEYGPEADICARDKNQQPEGDTLARGVENERKIPPYSGRYRTETADTNIFDEITMQSDNYKRTNVNKKENLRPLGRKRRDATSIFIKSRDGGSVEMTLKEPTGLNELDTNVPDERARSFSQVLVNTPPLSTILRPPQQESRQFLGYADKKRKTKPSKPIKEEGNSEEVGEENEEETTGQSQESANEAVAISPPPEGASVAEAKPIGLAIAGPGGVAASKPQGTAVAGPGGLAIARPVGTAIAGVDVEGSVPIGGQQKNKKKPKQEQEQTETDLHYVGGLTGPIGNPQPKEFADSVYYKTVKDTEGNNIQENFYLRGRPNTNGFQLKLGQQYGKYGLIPMSSNPVEGEGRLVKRTDFPIYFHGLLGNNDQGYQQFQNYQTQF